MNTIQYKLLNRINDPITIDPQYLKDLYKYYENGSITFNYSINISFNDFKKIFSTIYEILRLKINEEEIIKTNHSYLTLLMADARDGNNVDLNWFIDKIWYLCIAENKNFSKKYKDCIPFIQEQLIKKFNINENTKQKVSRKIYTKFMSH